MTETAPQFTAVAFAALQAYGDVWAQRQSLDRPATVLGDFLDRGNYPDEVRGTLRDAATYLLVELLANTTYWRAEQSNEVYALDLASLIAGAPPAAAGVDVTGMDIHPLVRIAWCCASGSVAESVVQSTSMSTCDRTGFVPISHHGTAVYRLETSVIQARHPRSGLATRRSRQSTWLLTEAGHM